VSVGGGTGVAVGGGTGVAVGGGTSVAVGGGTGVAEGGGTGVALGGIGVAVGGTGVLLGEIGVSVGIAVVGIGETAVPVAGATVGSSGVEVASVGPGSGVFVSVGATVPGTLTTLSGLLPALVVPPGPLAVSLKAMVPALVGQCVQDPTIVVPLHRPELFTVSVSLVTLPVTLHWTRTHCPTVISPERSIVKRAILGAEIGAGVAGGGLGTYKVPPARMV